MPPKKKAPAKKKPATKAITVKGITLSPAIKKKLTVAQQNEILNQFKSAIKSHCEKESKAGKTKTDILKSVGSIIAPHAKDISKSVLSQFIMPYVKRKIGLK